MLAVRFSVSEEEISLLNVDSVEKGELFFTFYFANKSGVPAAEIARLKKDGKGWGEMNNEFNLAPGSHGKAMGKLSSGR